MATKCTGAQVKAWFKDGAFWEEMIIDDDEWEVNGEEREYLGAPEALRDDDVVRLLSGTLISEKHPDVYVYLDAPKKLSRWLRAQTHEIVRVEFLKDQREAFEAHVKKFDGAKIK